MVPEYLLFFGFFLLDMSSAQQVSVKMTPAVSLNSIPYRGYALMYYYAMKPIQSIQIPKPILRITEPKLGMFVLILMHFLW